MSFFSGLLVFIGRAEYELQEKRNDYQYLPLCALSQARRNSGILHSNSSNEMFRATDSATDSATNRPGFSPKCSNGCFQLATTISQAG